MFDASKRWQDAPRWAPESGLNDTPRQDGGGLRTAVVELLARGGRGHCDIHEISALSGGCIHGAARARMADGEYLFVKHAEAGAVEAFRAEADGLEALAESGAFRVPTVVASGEANGQALLVLEFIDRAPAGGDPARFGEALAALHATLGESFGWHRDNFIGTTPQHNAPADEWGHFWWACRLHPLLERLEAAGDARPMALAARLEAATATLLAGHHPAPSLLHGDLWAGNGDYDSRGQPVVFDPAVYCGDREADLAMTELFGGFPARVYDAYQAVAPLAPGYPLRRELYNLYHVLNHALLFGGGYAARACRMIERLCAEAGS